MTHSLLIAACQPVAVYNNVPLAVQTLVRFARRAQGAGAALVVFPECFLQGYVYRADEAPSVAMDLESALFQGVLDALADLDLMIVFGMIERQGDALFNTAVVVQHGRVLGRYRKHCLLAAESVFEPGQDFPIFECGPLRFGITICNDTNYSHCAQAVAEQGANVLLCLANNMLPLETAEKWKDKHLPIRAQRAKESGLSILSSDVTGRHQKSISYGPTALIDPQGQVVSQLPLLQEGLLVERVSFEALG